MTRERLAADVLRELAVAELVLAHLRRVTCGPLSRYELARALGLPHPSGSGKDRVGRALERLEADGLAMRVIGPADEHDIRPVTRWRAGEGR